MKFLVFFLFLIGFIHLLAEPDDEEMKEARASFSRHFSAAHPVPVNFKTPPPSDYLFSNTPGLPNFLNVNATMDELESEQNKMQNESSIAVNPKNPKNLIASAVDYRAASSTWVYVSSDGGYKWKNINLGKPYPTWQSSNDPSVYFDAEGIGYLCYGGFGNVSSTEAGLVGENGVFIAKTTDEGVTWKAHTPVIIHLGNQTLDSNFEDKYYVQVDNSKKSPYYRQLYVPWKRVTPRDSATQIVISKSVDFGSTWSKPVNISARLARSSEDTTFGQSFPLCSTGPDGEVYVIWNHGIEHGVGFAKSLDGGATFTAPRIIQKYKIFGQTKLINGQGYRHTVKGTVRAEAYPVIATDISDGPRKGYVYLTWSADNYPNVYFSRSTDKGETWSTPVIVHSDTTNDQFWEWLSIDAVTGDLAIMYLDSRNDPKNIMIECFVSYSSDGGTTWTDRRVSDINNDIRLNPFANRAFAGDYSGNAFHDGIIYPSFVDMRNAVTNIADSDIMTAIVNTRAPSPPENFKEVTDAANPKELKLTWTPPTTRAFGQELKPEDFIHRIAKNGNIIATVSGSTDTYTDTDILAFEKYDYKIYAVASKDSSIARELTAYPGGSKQPDVPVIVSAKGNNDKTINFEIKIPNLRSDKITQLANLKGLRLYRNGVEVKSIDLNPTDTGKVITISDLPAETGFYKYKVKVFDYFTQLSIETVSEFSGEKDVFTGSAPDVLTENFDEPVLPLYFRTSKWVTTDEVAVSGSKSLSNSPYSNYKADQFDTLIFIPVTMPKDEDLYMSFFQIASLFPNDSAHIEISYNEMNNWEELKHFNHLDYESWKDKVLNNADWRHERLKIPYKEGAERVFVRLNFFSNPISFGEGWYFDDVVIGTKETTVDEVSFENHIRIFPNPANDFVNIISGNENLKKVKLYNINGMEIFEYFSDDSGRVKIDLSKFSSGAYFVEIMNVNGNSVRKMLFINK